MRPVPDGSSLCTVTLPASRPAVEGQTPAPSWHRRLHGAPGGAADEGRPGRTTAEHAAAHARRYRVWTVSDPRGRWVVSRPGGVRSVRRATSGPPRPGRLPRRAPQPARAIWWCRVLPSHSSAPPLAAGLERATFDQRRTLVELLVDRIVVDAPDVEIRYVIPLTGLARRNGALRPHHRALPPARAQARAGAPALQISRARPAVPGTLSAHSRPRRPPAPRPAVPSDPRRALPVAARGRATPAGARRRSPRGDRHATARPGLLVSSPTCRISEILPLYLGRERASVLGRGGAGSLFSAGARSRGDPGCGRGGPAPARAGHRGRTVSEASGTGGRCGRRGA